MSVSGDDGKSKNQKVLLQQYFTIKISKFKILILFFINIIKIKKKLNYPVMFSFFFIFYEHSTQNFFYFIDRFNSYNEEKLFAFVVIFVKKNMAKPQCITFKRIKINESDIICILYIFAKQILRQDV